MKTPDLHHTATANCGATGAISTIFDAFLGVKSGTRASSSRMKSLRETDVPSSPQCVNFVPPTGTPTTIPSYAIGGGQAVKLAIIEFVAATCFAGAGDDIKTVSINSPGISGIQNFVAPVKIFTDAQGTKTYTFSQATKFIAFPGRKATSVS